MENGERNQYIVERVTLQNIRTYLESNGYSSDYIEMLIGNILKSKDAKKIDKKIRDFVDECSTELCCGMVKAATHIIRHSSGAPLKIYGKVINVEVIPSDDPSDFADFVGYITVGQEDDEDITFFTDSEIEILDAIDYIKHNETVTYVLGND